MKCYLYPPLDPQVILMFIFLSFFFSSLVMLPLSFHSIYSVSLG